ncbi:sigma-70 family RNA polymerase sigma factor [Myxococcota bacterium]|nr:sigma-70 family RNA polymerase sigma factor [Myxococcota bacterium]
MQPSDPDVRLMLAYRDGDEAALASLYRRWAARLLRYLERIVREPAIAEELVQDTFVRVLDARERYAPEARFSTWLFHIARNLALNELARSRSRHPHWSTDAGPDAGSDATDDGRTDARPRLVLVATTPAPDDAADAQREQARFGAALAELPERQQTALWLAVVEGQSYDEIAALLGSSVQSVKNLVHRARANLADRMSEPARVVPAAEGKR